MRSSPEYQLHKAVAEYLTLILTPKGIPWTSVGHGGGGKIRGAQLKAAGLQPGWPDIQIIGPNGRYIGIELKAGSSLSPSQKQVHRTIEMAGGVVKICRSLEDVWTVLEWLAGKGPFPRPF